MQGKSEFFIFVWGLFSDRALFFYVDGLVKLLDLFFSINYVNT
jgi:hypothetical protein